MNNGITLEEALLEIQKEIMKELFNKDCQRVEFLRGQISLINKILTEGDIDKSVIVRKLNNYFK